MNDHRIDEPEMTVASFLGSLTALFLLFPFWKNLLFYVLFTVGSCVQVAQAAPTPEPEPKSVSLQLPEDIKPSHCQIKTARCMSCH